MTIKDYLKDYYPNYWHEINYPTGNSSISYLSEPNRYISGIFPISIIDTDTIKLEAGVLNFYEKSDRTRPKLNKVQITETTVSLATIFADIDIADTGTAYAYISNTGTVEISIEYPAIASLGDRIYIAQIEYVNDEIIEIKPFIITNDAPTKRLLSNGGAINVNVKLRPAKFNPQIENMKLQIIGGEVEILGAKSLEDLDSPHTITIDSILGDDSATDFVVWDEYAPDGTLIATDVSDLDFDRFYNPDTNQVENLSSGNISSIKYFYVDAEGKFICIIGAEEYNATLTAIQRYMYQEKIAPVKNKALIATVAGKTGVTDGSIIWNLMMSNLTPYFLRDQEVLVI